MNREVPTRVVSVHDVSPATLESCRTLLKMCESSGVVTTLLVVPGPWRGADPTQDQRFIDWLNGAAERGHEVSLHGWVHQGPRSGIANRLVARGCGEFASVTRAQAEDLLTRGLNVLDSLGHHPVGFTAPGWLLSVGARQALTEMGFEYTTTHLGVVDLQGDRTLRVPAFCQRPDSVFSHVGARIVRRLVVSRAVQELPIRLALHPEDLHDDYLRATTQSLIQVMGLGNTSTYAHLVRYFSQDAVGVS